ncbi:hypothetical protein Bresu_0698 [Brevundimonas subvibrioides ATCC 15264]|uniref:TonB C-terminal domain-containing protein n=1 Tax=Brevundimonas subvibrioides (strain ATCC 15264 / DSM 4735 / LMG 14903 / NBRC 16000 / CB 81) TaxID=633149 RepID=D9QLS9_BRESC|nr:hypothetical protein Bresu_0698 [Brevundimonas subvibrioides ATCC 15264]
MSSTSRPVLGLAALALASALGGLAQAQTPDTVPPADDWTLADRAGITAAYVRFDSGIDIVVRCKGESDSIETLIMGLPAGEGRSRPLRVSLGDQPLQERTWYVGDEATTAISGSPARFARTLRNGGVVNMVVPGGAQNGRNLRYILNLPASSSAVDQVLTACGKPLVDPRDLQIEEVPEGGLPTGIAWARPPLAIYPEGFRTYAWGFATITCLSQRDGSLDSCETEAQYPLDGGFGAAALRAMRLAKVQVPDQPDQPVPRRLVSFTLRFVVPDVGSTLRPETGSRIRPAG